ncbi:MAG: efflux RND transporter periplasmic adaptor subunit [Gammaproteobacteria bacterium]|jgi:RND family efflux transporter MFP subunit|nr:efflux RND transporter periplasmic adaptor subunit [Gammaproteobacteria bacterium]MBT4078140.1 efflux RND transporter periplasmic adaptor subunit [Gammaproteobacteria bacterium]MBT4195550.1 efflux RND transporter periplasmic adaptor subunit [Gammaproteobacteria bacterium]MBT4861422.1 efflux RND transporter periplasmic adaptor subunit [Gammaproteobacteria bacterium]MBT6553956.1 efflux RND transporter periplasmic adaptor subunit [Gammaproteobacteria bacterium]
MSRKLFKLKLLLILSSLLVGQPGLASEYQFAKVIKNEKQHSIVVAGTVTAGKSITLTAQSPGRVIQIAGKEGSIFKADSLLVELDDTALKAKIDSAYASHDSARVAIRNAKMQLNKELESPANGTSSAPGGMGMPSMMDQMFTNPMQDAMGYRNKSVERASNIINRETDLMQAQSKRLQAEAQIRQLQASQRDTKSIAPFKGVIEKLYVEVGDTVQPGQKILNFSSFEDFQVEADIPSRVKPGLKEGMSLNIRVDGINKPVTAKLTRIFPVANLEDHTIHIEMKIASLPELTVGMYAEIIIPDRSISTQVVAVPKSSIIRRGGLPLVYIVDKEGKAKLRIVRLGSYSLHGLVEILSGVDERDSIILNPSADLRSGTQVVEMNTSTDAEK